jgi:DNA polymerase-3 subunit epsilon
MHALVRVLNHRLDCGETVIRELIRNAAQPNWLIEAPGTLFAMNAALRDRGYDWDTGRRQRWRFVASKE